MKKVALINDLSGIGRCSLTVALPIISAMGHECAAFPTAILSNHTGFDHYTFYDFTEHLKDYADCWQKLETKFDTVYSGFLGSEHQVDITIDFMDRFGRYALKLVDPVMGDDGVIYDTFSASMREHIKRLVKRADIITPNLTELCELCGKEYVKVTTLEAIKDMCASIGVKKVVVTGLDSTSVAEIEDGVIVNFVYDGGNSYCVKNKKTPVMYCGTGDTFASVLCGALTDGKSLEDAVKLASAFTADATEYTYKNGGEKLYGIAFEKMLYKLVAKGE